MESPSRLHVKTLILIFIMVLAGPLGNVLLGKGMKRMGKVNPWPPAELPHMFVLRLYLRHDMARSRLPVGVLCGVYDCSVVGRL